MRGEAQPFLKFLHGADKRFIIPVYQRNYSWQTQQCAQLFNDLKRLINEPEKKHFFGSVVSSKMENGRKEDYFIIDGQQRLTTLSILLVAIVNLMRDGLSESTNPQLQDRIRDEHLVDKYNPDHRKMRLKPIQDDCDAFDALFESEDEFIQSSNVTANYLFFKEKILQENIGLDDLYDAIGRLEIIDIFLDKDDNPQLIFESLNSTGLALEEGDKIRNYILMSLPPMVQEEFYKKYWHKIEKNTEVDNKFYVSDFIRSYLTLKLSRTIVIRNLYFDFKDYSESFDREELLQDLLHYAEIYQEILNPSKKLGDLQENLIRLDQLDLTVIHPYLLSVLDYWKKGKISILEAKEILFVIESYLFRRLIVGYPSNTLNKIFATLARDVEKRMDAKTSYADIFKHILLIKEQSAKFPTDEEFTENLTTRDIYAFNSRNKHYLFSRFENENSKEQINVIERIKNGDYTIEHIMPQTLSSEWKKALGANYQDIHKKWIHTLANLTLTGYNSKYSNLPFSEKLSMKNGFKDSSLRLNKLVSECERWGERELELRQASLVNKSLELWKYPHSTYVIPQNEVLSYTLADEIDFTNKAISSYEFLGKEVLVSSWKDMFKDIVSQLSKDYPAIINRLAENGEGAISNGEKLTTSHEEFEGRYLYCNTSTASKISALNYFFKNCDIDPEDLTFNILKRSQT